MKGKLFHSCWLLLVGIITLLLLAGDGDAITEDRSDSNMYNVLRAHMSTKTIYPAPEMNFSEENNDQDSMNSINSELQCTPIQLNYVIRHGTRYPTIKDIMRIDQIHKRLLATQTASYAHPWLTTWTNPYDENEAGWLADTGVEELVEMGERLRSRFGDRLHAHFRADKFIFEHTWKVRTEHSASAFAYGFFHGHQPVYYHVDPIGSDHELRFFDNCPAFDQRIDQNKSATIEHAKYRQSPQMQRNLAKFRQFVNGVDSRTAAQELTQKDMEAAYAGCAFDVATKNIYDQWCSFFDEEMILSMDYFHDLKHFYKKSHGNPLAYEIAAPLLQDIFVAMQTRIQGTSDIEGHFRFAHAETILPLASLLNLSYFDRHLNDREGHFLADTPLKVAKTRVFKGSVLSPFAANIGFVLYKCADSDEHSARETRYMVKVLLNEHQVTFPECNHTSLCNFNQLEQIFRKWIHEYDFHQECKIEFE